MRVGSICIVPNVATNTSEMLLELTLYLRCYYAESVRNSLKANMLTTESSQSDRKCTWIRAQQLFNPSINRSLRGGGLLKQSNMLPRVFRLNI